MPHDSLGPYKIEAPLGAGGMGEVYLATDTRLGRTVAIKVLPAAFATDPDRLARFEQEARAAAALNHPHIAAVYDVGVEGDTHYMVQERLEGQTLRERMEAGRLRLATVLTLATEIAEALAAAHAAGIVHRDLKPENIFVTRQGHAKVLDFGLAKLTERAATSDGSATQSPTVLGTSAGQIMGTAGYMAPEQVTGDGVDARADVFAFGCLLYELASGRRAFHGKNLPEVLHRLANEEPEALAGIEPGLPFELCRIVRKCMAKEPARRYQGTDDLAVDLRTLAAEFDSGRAAEEPLTQATEGATTRTSPLAMAALVLAGTLIGAGLYLVAGTAGVSDSAPQVTVHLPLEAVPGLDSGYWSQLALSPNGRFLAFATGRGPILLQDFSAAIGEHLLPETEGARAPFFSPDGQWLAYLGTDNRFYRVPVAGGRPQPFSERIGYRVSGASWRENGDIVIHSDFSSPVLLLPGEGGPVLPLFEMDAEAGEIGHGPASFLPDGDHVLYSYWDDRWHIGVRALSTGKRTPLTDGYGARYAPSGHLVWILAQQMMAATFDLTTFELGEPTQVLSTLGSTPGWGRTAYDFNPDGTLAYLRTTDRRRAGIVQIDEDGTQSMLRPGDRELRRVRISPDGTRLGLEVRTVDADAQIWSYDIGRDDMTPIGQGIGWDQFVFFSPDGTHLAYVSERLGSGDVFVRTPDGYGPETPLIAGPNYKDTPAWSPRGVIAASSRGTETGSSDILLYSVDEPGQGTPFIASDADEEAAAFSPDGRFVAYVSNRSGRQEVYVTAYPEGPGVYEWKVSTGGGTEPRWTRDGRQVFFFDPDQRVLRAPVIGTEPFQTGMPQPFTEVPVRDFDVAANGRAIIAIEALEPPRPRLVLNWFAELERRLPTR